MTLTAKSPLRYPGGKSRAIKQIQAQIPVNFTAYREPFVGGASVFLSIKALFQKRVERYWINDLHRDLICFWQTVQDDVEQLAQEIEKFKKKTRDGRELYTFLKDDNHMQRDFDRAVRFFIMNRITFSGVMDAGGYSQQAYEKRFTDSSIKRLRKVAYFLKDTEITQGDYEAVVCAPGDNVFIFLDPPYLSATKSKLYGKRGKLHTGFEHERFAEVMRNSPHRWLITYDDSPEIRDLFSFATITKWELQYGMNNYKQGKAARGKEVFIKNY